MANSVVLKRRRPRVQEEDLRSEDQRKLDETVLEIVEGVREGLFDSYLALLFQEVDDRIQIYQDVQREPAGMAPSEPKEKAEKLRTLKRPELVFTLKGRYAIKGESYTGVVMEFLGKVQADPDDEGPDRGRFLCIVGNSKAVQGKVYQLPYTAMGNLAANVYKGEEPSAPARKRECRKCGEDIEYSGKGRPSTVCDKCRKIS